MVFSSVLVRSREEDWQWATGQELHSLKRALNGRRIWSIACFRDGCIRFVLGSLAPPFVGFFAMET